MEDIIKIFMNINWKYVISTLLALGGIFYIIRPKLRYTIEVLPFVNPSKVDTTIKNKLKIIYDNQEVNDLSIAKVTILSKGTDACDFSAPIKIQFNSKILYAYPNKDLLTLGIAKEYVTSSKIIEFLPNYINKKEKIIFYAVLETPKKLEVKVTGRCKGCSNIKKIRSYKYLVYFIIFALGFSFPLILSSYLEHQSKTIIEKLEKTNIEIKTISTAIEEKIESLEQRNKKVEDKMEKTNKGVLLCKKAEEICSLCKYGVTLAIAKNVSLSEMEKIDLISKIDKFSSDMEMLNIKDESTQLPK